MSARPRPAAVAAAAVIALVAALAACASASGATLLEDAIRSADALHDTLKTCRFTYSVEYEGLAERTTVRTVRVTGSAAYRGGNWFVNEKRQSERRDGTSDAGHDVAFVGESEGGYRNPNGGIVLMQHEIPGHYSDKAAGWYNLFFANPRYFLHAFGPDGLRLSEQIERYTAAGTKVTAIAGEGEDAGKVVLDLYRPAGTGKWTMKMVLDPAYGFALVRRQTYLNDELAYDQRVTLARDEGSQWVYPKEIYEKRWEPVDSSVVPWAVTKIRFDAVEVNRSLDDALFTAQALSPRYGETLILIGPRGETVTRKFGDAVAAQPWPAVELPPRPTARGRWLWAGAVGVAVAGAMGLLLYLVRRAKGSAAGVPLR